MSLLALAGPANSEVVFKVVTLLAAAKQELGLHVRAGVASGEAPVRHLQKACEPSGATRTKQSSVWSSSGGSSLSATGSTCRTPSACRTSRM